MRRGEHLRPISKLTYSGSIIMFKQVYYIDPREIKGKPNLSIGRKGRINFNAGFVKKHGIKPDRMAADLYWNGEAKEIVFVFTEKDRAGSFPLVHFPYSSAAYVVADQFFTSNRLDPKRYAAASYAVETTRPEKLGIDDESGDAFVIHLAGTPSA
jgi:hypothetical protein